MGGHDVCRLQGKLVALAAEDTLAALSAEFRATSDAPAMRRLRELRDPSTDHGWLQCLHPVRGPTLKSDDFLDAVRLRLGADVCSPMARCALAARSRSTGRQFTRKLALKAQLLGGITSCPTMS